jgi:hypothetical protein
VILVLFYDPITFSKQPISKYVENTYSHSKYNPDRGHQAKLIHLRRKRACIDKSKPDRGLVLMAKTTSPRSGGVAWPDQITTSSQGLEGEEKDDLGCRGEQRSGNRAHDKGFSVRGCWC